MLTYADVCLRMLTYADDADVCRYVAREARLQNATKDKLMGQNKESHDSHETPQGSARLQDMYKHSEHNTLPSQETNAGEGGVGGWGGSPEEKTPL
jgi:hypothetical protein